MQADHRARSFKISGSFGVTAGLNIQDHTGPAGVQKAGRDGFFHPVLSRFRLISQQMHAAALEDGSGWK